MTNILGEIVGLVIAVYILAAIFVPAMQSYAAANTTGIPAGTVVILGVVSVIAVLSVIILMLKFVGVRL